MNDCKRLQETHHRNGRKDRPEGSSDSNLYICQDSVGVGESLLFFIFPVFPDHIRQFQYIFFRSSFSFRRKAVV